MLNLPAADMVELGRGGRHASLAGRRRGESAITCADVVTATRVQTAVSMCLTGVRTKVTDRFVTAVGLDLDSPLMGGAKLDEVKLQAQGAASCCLVHLVAGRRTGLMAGSRHECVSVCGGVDLAQVTEWKSADLSAGMLQGYVTDRQRGRCRAPTHRGPSTDCCSRPPNSPTLTACSLLRPSPAWRSPPPTAT